MGLVIIALLVYFLGFKKYYIRINDTSAANRVELTKVLKFQLGMTLTEINYVIGNTPYTVFAGKFLDVFTAKKKINRTGARAALVMSFLWKKVEESKYYGPDVDLSRLANPNGVAWNYLNEAIGRAIGTDANGEEVVVLASAQEAQYVDELLDKAEAAADDPLESGFLEKLAVVREAVSWALKRHWTHSWMIIGGVFLSIIILANFNSDNQGDIRRAEAVVTTIENWEEADTVFAEYPTDIVYFGDMNNPKHAKSDLLCRRYESYLRNKKSSEEYSHSADTATVKEVEKDYKNLAKEYEEYAEKDLKDYEKLNKMDFEDFQDYCVDVAEDAVDAAEGSAFLVWFLFITFLLMTPLYIMASYQYGYIIIKYQREANRLDNIKKVGFGIAAGLFGAGLAMQFFPDTIVKTRWSDGSTSTHREGDPTNYFILALKIGLFILAVIVVCFVSCFLMTYKTITGLCRNYDWKIIYNDVRTKFNALKK